MPETTGWDGGEIFEAASRGEVGLVYLVGQDPVGDWRIGSIAKAGLDRADFVVVQDAFLTPTAQLADIVLPAAILSERVGHFTAADGLPRELQRIERPPEGTMQDGQTFLKLSARYGAPIATGPALREEMRRLVRDPRGSSPQPRFTPPAELPPPRAVDQLYLDLSPQLFHSGSTTLHSALLKEFAPPVSLLLAPSDATELGISEGAMVRLSVGKTKLLLRALIDATVREGTVATLPQSLKVHARDFEDISDDMRWVSVEAV